MLVDRTGSRARESIQVKGCRCGQGTMATMHINDKREEVGTLDRALVVCLGTHGRTLSPVFSCLDDLSGFQIHHYVTCRTISFLSFLCIDTAKVSYSHGFLLFIPEAAFFSDYFNKFASSRLGKSALSAH